MRTLSLRLTHHALDFHVDVTLTEHEGRWLAAAMLAGEPDVGTGLEPREALRASLAALGEPHASELAASGGALVRAPEPLYVPFRGREVRVRRRRTAAPAPRRYG